MFNTRKQEFGDISNSNVIAINGDVTIDGERYNNILQTLIEIVRKDFESYSYAAIATAKEEIANYLKRIFEKLAKEHLTHLTEKFQKPDEANKEYSVSLAKLAEMKKRLESGYTSFWN